MIYKGYKHVEPLYYNLFSTLNPSELYFHLFLIFIDKEFKVKDIKILGFVRF